MKNILSIIIAWWIKGYNDCRNGWRVHHYLGCFGKDSPIDGAVKFGNTWAIPEDVNKPADARISSGKYIKNQDSVDQIKCKGE